MHPRNIYKTRPNFAELGKQFDFFAPFVTLDQTGNTKINFKDPAALRALSKALLLRDFGLDVDIPEGVLVPTVPLRLNYILWLEDLLMEMGFEGEQGTGVRGIDVGTGATAIYTLLAAKKNNWSMVGTEVNSEYVPISRSNVEKNGLSKLIKIVPTEKGGPSMEPVLKTVEDAHFAFTMCNPPFFGSDEETDSVSKGRFDKEDNAPLRPPPSAAKTGRSVELVAEGGELQFVQGLIQESLKYPRKVRIYSTMIGIKRHLKTLIRYLRSKQIVNYSTTEFIQGKTMRWGLAWSFTVNILPPKPDLLINFPELSTLVNFEELIGSYLQDLTLHYMHWVQRQGEGDVEEDPDPESVSILEIVATENTWSHQRRKRRMEKMLMKQKEMSEGASPPKSCKSENVNGSSVKGLGEPSTSARTEVESPQSPSEDQKSILLHCFLEFLREEDGTAQISMRFRDGTMGKQGLHQIMQYLKNRYDKDRKDPSSQLFQMTST